MHTDTARGHKASARPPRQKGTRFTLRAPLASAVYLAGSFNDWSLSALEMKRSQDGIYWTEVALPPGRYEYKFLVDGRWCCDVTDSGLSETAEGCVPNDFGSMNRVIDVAP